MFLYCGVHLPCPAQRLLYLQPLCLCLVGCSRHLLDVSAFGVTRPRPQPGAAMFGFDQGNFGDVQVGSRP